MSASSVSGCRGSTTDRSSGPGRRFPVLYDLVGFTGSGLAHLNWKPFSENLAERAARLVREGRMGPVILVFPDCFTALGGNQYVNSSAIGRYADYLRGRDRSVRRPGVPHARLARAPGLLRQVVGRLRRHDARHEVHGALGRDRQPFGRCVLRLPVPGRLAEHAERTREVPQARAQGRGGIGAARYRCRARAAPGARRRPRAPLPRRPSGAGRSSRTRKPTPS